MSVVSTSRTTISCDLQRMNCTPDLSVDSSVVAARHRAAKLGWTVGYETRCPSCVTGSTPVAAEMPTLATRRIYSSVHPGELGLLSA